MRRLEEARTVRREDDGFAQRGPVLPLRQLRPPACDPHPTEDVVPSCDHLGARVVGPRRIGLGEAPTDGERQLAVACALQVGTALGVEGRGRLGQSREQGRLGRRQVPQVGDAEEDLGGRGDTVGVLTVEDLVQIRRDDPLLALLARVRPRHPRRLKDLLHLPLVLIRLRPKQLTREQPSADQLLGDRGRAALARARDVLVDRGRDRVRIEPFVLPERRVLHRGRRVEHELGDIVEADDAPLLRLEPGELDLPRPVVDDRRLGEVKLFQEPRIRKVLLHRVQRRDGRAPHCERTRREHGDESEDEHEGKGRAETASAPGLGARARDQGPAHGRG